MAALAFEGAEIGLEAGEVGAEAGAAGAGGMNMMQNLLQRQTFEQNVIQPFVQQLQNQRLQSIQNNTNLQIQGRSDLAQQYIQSNENMQAFNQKSQFQTQGLNFGGSLLSAGVGYLMTKSLMDEQASLQRQNFDFATTKFGNALSQSGLPSWLAYAPSMGGMFPHQTSVINGANTMTSALPGNTNNILWNGSTSQVALGTGDIPSAM